MNKQTGEKEQGGTFDVADSRVRYSKCCPILQCRARPLYFHEKTNTFTIRVIS